MAVVVSDNRNGSYDGNISTVNGFYRAEAGQLSMAFGTISLTSTYTYGFTFANAGNCQGFVLPLQPVATNINRPLTVELQENVASVWTTRASKTLTTNEIRVSSTIEGLTGVYITAFKFATPYAVDTTVGKWRLQTTSTAGTSNWLVRASASSVPSFITWCDNQVTFASNADQFVAVDTIYLDSAATLRGILFTGDTVNAIAGWVCSGTDRTPANVAMLRWSPTPASSYKVTSTGLIYIGTTSGFSAGTSSVHIPSSAMGEFEAVQASVGTSTANLSSGFVNAIGGGGSIFIYGEIPSVEDTELLSAAAAAQPNIVTKVATGWGAGDRIVIGRVTARGNIDPQIYTISSVAGTTITLTTNLASARSIDASVIKLNGYGFKLSSPNATGARHTFGSMLNIIVQGVEYLNWQWWLNATGAAVPARSEDLVWQFRNSSLTTTNTTTTKLFVDTFNPAINGVVIDNVNCYRTIIQSNNFVGNGQGSFAITNCIFIHQDAGVTSNTQIMNGIYTYTDNKHENSASTMVFLQGFKGTFRRNKIWGSAATGGSATGALRFSSLFLFDDWGNNTYDNNHTAITITGTSFNVRSKDDEFGQAVANFYDIYSYFRALVDVEFENSKGNLIIGYSPPMLDGFTLRLTNVNQTSGNDRIEKAEGILYRAGNGLADTTKRVGDYCLKFVPYSTATAVLDWKQSVPTEDIQNQSMMVGVWINIANSAYWAGSHQMPRLSVNYDNGTTVFSEATQTTGWQLVFVPFTPTTTYGQLTVTVSGRTVASTANAGFYVADMSVLYPAGHTLNLGSMNTWANALPVMPSISTTVSAADVWAADPTQFGANTVGDKVNKIKNDTGIIPATL